MAQKTAGASQRLGLYWLAAGTIGAALFGSAPAAWEIVERVQYLDTPSASGLERWTLLVLLLGCIELAYAVYLIQLPDWASLRTITWMLLGMAGFYAMALAIVLIADPSGWLIGPGGVQLADKLGGGKAALWCLCMVSVSATLAFFAGRLSS